MRTFFAAKKQMFGMLALALGVSGCTKKAQTSVTSGATSGAKVFNYYRPNSEKSLDPQKQLDQASGDIVSNVYDTLLTYDYLKRPYTLVPSLLTKMPELQPDGLTYVFELRPGVHFIDDPAFVGGKGRELTADDVLYTIKRFADGNVNTESWFFLNGAVEGLDAFHAQTLKAGPGKINYDRVAISGLKKDGPYKFEVKMTKKNPLLLYAFAVSGMSIVPKEAVEHYGDQFAWHPVGTGPFYLKEFSRRGTVTLYRNPQYFGTYPQAGMPGDKEAGLLADAGKKVPFVDQVVLPLIEETQPAMLKFKNGEIDWIAMDKDNFTQMAYKDAKGFHLKPEYAAKYNMYVEPGLDVEYWQFNMKDPVVGKNAALRQAISYALNREGFIDLMMNGRAVPAHTIVPPGIAGSEKDIGPIVPGYNLALAKQKLAEAGYPGGKGLPVLTIEYRDTSSTVRQQWEYDRNQLAEAGIVAKANFQTFSAFLKKQDEGNFQIADGGWMADYPDAEDFYQLLYGPNKAPGPNAGSFNDPQYNALYEKMRYMENGPERFAVMKQMSEIMAKQMPLVLVYSTLRFGLYQKWVQNMKRNFMLDNPFQFFDINEQLKAKGL